MTVDITPLVQTVLLLGAATLSTFGSMALRALQQRFNVQTSVGQQALWETALNKSLAFGVTQSDEVIKEKGWDHVDTKDAVVASALTYLVAREPAALAAVGLTGDFKDQHSRTAIQQALTRALPDAFTKAAASPATPPAPVQPQVIMAPPAAV